jgi:hypothetical protein
MPLRLKEVATTPDGAINRMRMLARQVAAKEFGAAKFGGFQPRGGEYGFSDLRPTHIRCPLIRAGTFISNATAFGRWTHGTLNGNTAYTWFNTNVHEDAIVLLYGMFNNTASPTIHTMFPRFGGEDLPFVQLDEAYGMWEPKWYFELGNIIGPRQPIRADLTATGATARLTENIGFIGEVCARRRYVIVQSAPAP